MLGYVYILFVRNRDYDITVGMKIVAYNIIIVFLNQMLDKLKRKIMNLII